MIPVSEHQDTVGPLTRTVKDGAYILQAIAGVDPYDNYTSTIPNGIVPNYIESCQISGLSGVRLGVPRNAMSLQMDNETQLETEAFEQALEVLLLAGATIVDAANFTAADEFLNSSIPGLIPRADFVVNLRSYLNHLLYNPKSITSLDQLRNFTQTFPPEDYPTRDTGRWDEALQVFNNTDPQFWPAYQQNLYYGGEGGLLGAIKRHNLDAVILPASFAPHWAAPVGSPIVTVPMGFYPAGTPIVRNPPWDLVHYAPNIP